MRSGKSIVMTCQECLAQYTDHVDAGDVADATSWRSHLERCSACARYHRVVQSGLRLVRELPRVEPSSDFHPRLQYGIFRALDDRDRHARFASAGAASSLAVAAAIALVAWGPVLLSRTEPEPVPVEVVSETVEERVRPAGYARPAVLVGGTRAPTLGVAFPGPYSPLIVEAPVTGTTDRTARNVFTAYFPGLD